MWCNPVRMEPGRVCREDYEYEQRETVGSLDALEFFKVSMTQDTRV